MKRNDKLATDFEKAMALMRERPEKVFTTQMVVIGVGIDPAEEPDRDHSLVSALARASRDPSTGINSGRVRGHYFWKKPELRKQTEFELAVTVNCLTRLAVAAIEREIIVEALEEIDGKIQQILRNHHIPTPQSDLKETKRMIDSSVEKLMGALS